jgi:hypothetical protein
MWPGFFFSPRHVRVWESGLLFNVKKGLTTAGVPPSIGVAGVGTHSIISPLSTHAPCRSFGSVGCLHTIQIQPQFQWLYRISILIDLHCSQAGIYWWEAIQIYWSGRLALIPWSYLIAWSFYVGSNVITSNHKGVVSQDSQFLYNRQSRIKIHHRTCILLVKVMLLSVIECNVSCN